MQPSEEILPDHGDLPVDGEEAGHPPDHPAEEVAPGAWPSAMADAMDLSVSYPGPEVCVVEVTGELDALTTPFLDECLRGLLDIGPMHLVIDLEAVTFLGSAGLSVLMQCSRRLEIARPGSVMHLSGTASREVHRPLELVGLLPLFRIQPTLGEALAQIFSGPGPVARTDG